MKFNNRHELPGQCEHTVIPAQPGYSIINVFDDDELPALTETIIAWQIETFMPNDGIEAMSFNIPITVNGSEEFVDGILCPDGKVVVQAEMTYTSYDEFLFVKKQELKERLAQSKVTTLKPKGKK